MSIQISYVNLTVSDVDDVAVTVITLNPPDVDVLDVTPAENVAVIVSGIFMMTTKVSSATPAPNKPVITMSRTNPRIRETNVQKDTNPLLARSFKDFFCGERPWLRLTPLQMVLNPKKLS